MQKIEIAFKNVEFNYDHDDDEDEYDENGYIL